MTLQDILDLVSEFLGNLWLDIQEWRYTDALSLAFRLLVLWLVLWFLWGMVRKPAGRIWRGLVRAVTFPGRRWRTYRKRRAQERQHRAWERRQHEERARHEEEQQAREAQRQRELEEVLKKISLD